MTMLQVDYYRRFRYVDLFSMLQVLWAIQFLDLLCCYRYFRQLRYIAVFNVTFRLSCVFHVSRSIVMLQVL